jgi:arylsulfatase A-like enzyme
VLEALARNGFADNTLVIFTSDNGGVKQYRPVDYPEIEGHRINGPLRGQKTTVYEGGVRVPFIARWPGRIPAGSEDDAMIALTDVFATMAELFEAPLPDDAAEDSFSFLGPLLDRAPAWPARESLIMDSYREMMAIRRGSWKLILGQHGGGANYRKTHDPERPKEQLFNLDEEIREWRSHYREQPDRVAELTAEFERLRDAGRSR